MTPEPCLRTGEFSGCRSHGACADWGYCRERNMEDGVHGATNAQVQARRAEAAARNEGVKS